MNFRLKKKDVIAIAVVVIVIITALFSVTQVRAGTQALYQHLER